jgi:TRAP-type mannitol/chloroaromatic compound transport system permease small subunit
MLKFIRFADALSACFGKAFAWLIIVMAFGTGYEVFVRYVLNSPTPWALDVSFIMYGSLFMMGGAYTLS